MYLFTTLMGLLMSSTTSLAGSQHWYVVNDTVMGGQSSSSVSAEVGSGGLVFQGCISLEGGGFASTRTRIDSSPHTLRLQTGSDVFLVLDVTGDGQQYKVGLRESDQVRQPT